MNWPLLRTGKCWQTPDLEFIWQVSAAGKAAVDLPRKFFLILDVRQQSRAVRLSLDKPEATSAQMALSNLVRKHLPHTEIRDVQRSGNGDIHIFCGPHDSPPWQLQLSNEKPPALSLVMPDGTMLVRWGLGGTFTKRKLIPQGESTGQSILEDVWASLRPGATTETPACTPSAATMGTEQRDLLRRLRRRLKTVRKSLEREQQQLPAVTAMAALELQITALSTHLHEIPSGVEQHRIDDPEVSPDPLLLELDPQLTPGENLDQAHRQRKRLQRSQDIGVQRLRDIEMNVTRLQADIQRLEESPQSQSELAAVADRHKLGLRVEVTGRVAPPVAKPYREFRSRDGLLIQVGKSAADNDALTKAARANDLWFHVSGMTGSHVIIAARQGSISPTTVRQAAILALHFSPLRKDMAGEVYRTARRFLRKRKGLAPGLWLIDQSETIFIRYTQEELDEIMNTAVAGGGA